MASSQSSEGFASDALRDALAAALGGRPAEIERLFCLLGAVLTPKPNLKLAAAFGVEMAAATGAAAPLLRRFSAEDAAPDTDRAFLPIAAAYGWAGRVRARRDVEEAWAALGELASDERSPVRLGALDALIGLGCREGGADALVARGLSWLEDDAFEGDRERRLGASALALDAIADGRVLACLRDTEGLLAYLSRALGEIADARRSDDRSEARRRLLFALPRTMAAVMAGAHTGADARRWFEEESAAAQQPDARAVLSDAILALRAPGHGQSTAVIDSLRRALAGSAKPLRYAARMRPGSGRGKASRRTH